MNECHVFTGVTNHTRPSEQKLQDQNVVLVDVHLHLFAESYAKSYSVDLSFLQTQ